MIREKAKRLRKKKSQQHGFFR